LRTLKNNKRSINLITTNNNILADLKMKYDIANTQWYDIYTQGLIPGAEEAGKLISHAQNAVDSGEMKIIVLPPRWPILPIMARYTRQPFRISGPWSFMVFQERKFR
jgi:hypothetical protein